MGRKAWLLLLLLAPPAQAGDKQLRALVETLSQQVQQLSHRVTDLESELAQERQTQRQTLAEPPTGKPTPAASAEPAMAAGAGSRWTKTPSPPEAATEAAKAKPATVGDIKGSIKIPGTDTSLAIGGYAKLDTLYSSVSTSTLNSMGNQLLLLSSIPAGPARLGANSQTTVHAKETRLWFKSFTPSRLGDINTYVEFDWFGSADSYTPRLRHAYGSIGPFLAGQTWSTFLNVATIPETLDLGSPVAIGTLRQPLLRWSWPFSLGGQPFEFQAAAESPNTRLALPHTAAIASHNDDRYPDLIGRLNFNPEWGSLSLVGMGREIRYSPPTGAARSQWGGAVSVAGKVKTSGLDNLRFSLSYGNALGRYISLNTFTDAALDGSGRVMDLNTTYSALLAYQHWWSDTWRSSLAYGFAQSDLPAYANGGLTRQGQSVHANLLWSPVVQTTFGLEYIYATRTQENGLHGDLHRVQFSSRFNF